MKNDVDIKKTIKKVLPYCGLYVLTFTFLLFGDVLLQCWNMGIGQCMDGKIQKWEVGNLLDISNAITADGDGYITTGSDPCFVLEVPYGQMVDIVLAGLQEEEYGEVYYAAEGEYMSQQWMNLYTYRNGHNLVMIPVEHSDIIRVDISTREGVYFEVEGIVSGSPWRLFLYAYWKQLAVVALVVVVLWWFI